MGRISRFCIVTMVLVLAAITLGCNSPGYQKFILREGIAHFSFEYPENYEEILVHTQFGFVDAVFIHTLPDYYYTDSLFHVAVHSSGIFERSDDAKATLEKKITIYGEIYEDYQVLERSEVNVDGVEAEFLACSYTIVEVSDDETIWEPSPSFVLEREVFFDYNGYIWNISIMSNETRAEADEAVWEHLLETFQILD